ncbi:hypothetical protein DPEC_G00292720 [Dallia pectoralis]|uniref:Uncharacterized protein n=1 Tax=Dallia pectoralis TaxID=75939 RepID=A0ACC2FI24_DALPE|nr:hypothetical protein DPEC_G00292720 [Dallia pectoralis]
MAGRLLKVSSFATAVVASSGIYLYSQHLDLNDLSLVRFGRAAATTAVISYDYMSLRNMEYGSEEYWQLKSQNRGQLLCVRVEEVLSTATYPSQPL